MFSFVLKQAKPRSNPVHRNYSSSACRGFDKPLNRPYRPCVGAIIFNVDGKLLCGKRIDISYWQFPQGGMHPEEDPVASAIREINEEIGLTPSQYKIIKDQHLPLEKFTYHQPLFKDGKEFAGQEQRYVLIRWDGSISECNLLGTGTEPPEFSQIAWLTWDQLIQLSVPSRTFIYARLRNTVKPMISEYLVKTERKGGSKKEEETPALPPRPGVISWGEYLSYSASHLGTGDKVLTKAEGKTPLNYFRNSGIIPEIEKVSSVPIVSPSDLYLAE